MKEQTNKAVQDNTNTAIRKLDLQLFSDPPADPVPPVDPTPSEPPASNPNSAPAEPPTTTPAEPPQEPPAKPPTTPTGAPEKYTDFKVPDGFTAPVEKFSEFAKAQNWTQEQAQSAVDFYTKEIAPQMQAQHEAQVTKWETESKAKYGKAGIETANQVLSRFSNIPECKELIADLQTSGLGSKPSFVGFFKALGPKILEPNAVNPSTGPNNSKRLYPNSPDMY